MIQALEGQHQRRASCTQVRRIFRCTNGVIEDDAASRETSKTTATSGGDPLDIQTSEMTATDEQRFTIVSDTPEQADMGAEHGKTAEPAEPASASNDVAEAYPESTGLINPDDRLEGLEALLIYRVCLYGALMSLTADTSDLLSSVDRSKIVQAL